MSNHFKWIPWVGKHGSRHQNEVFMWIIKGDIGGLVIDLINMLIRLIKKNATHWRISIRQFLDPHDLYKPFQP